MTRRSWARTVLLSVLMMGCGGDDDSGPRTIEGSCAQFCEKWMRAGCSIGFDDCMGSCTSDAEEYPDCNDEFREAAHCFVQAEVTCVDVLDLTVPKVVGDECTSKDDALDHCRQASMPGADGGTGP